MREKIAEIIRDEVHCGYQGELLDVADSIDQILSLMSEEIKKVKNPVKGVHGIPDTNSKLFTDGFNVAKRKILTLLRNV